MSYLNVLLSILIVFLPASSLARPLYRLPVGTRIQTPKEELQGYTLEEMKMLLKMDVDLEFYETVQLPKIKEQLEATKKIIEAKDVIIGSKDGQLKTANQDRERLTNKWSEENKLRHECENKPKFGSWVAWGLAALLGGTALALGIVLVVKEAR